MPSCDLLPVTMERLSNGRELRVCRIGSGPALILLHGYPENLQIWHALAPMLASHFEVTAFDWPGLGYSEEWPGGATPQLLARRLKSLLDEWHLPSATIVGMDMGGQPALAFAAEYPGQVDRLVVMNSLVFGDEQTSWEIRLLRKYGLNRFLLRHFPRLIFGRAESTFLPGNARLNAALRDDFRTAFWKPAVRRFVSRMCAGYQGTLHKLPALYEQIDCPALVLWAEHDKHFPLIQAHRLHQAIRGSHLKIISGGTHWMMERQAGDVADAITGWMNH
jgi:pimeloyl-ACP methyl ester carboxylesterase